MFIKIKHLPHILGVFSFFLTCAGSHAIQFEICNESGSECAVCVYKNDETGKPILAYGGEGTAFAYCPKTAEGPIPKGYRKSDRPVKH